MTVRAKGVRLVFAESGDDEQIIERVAALDIGKAEIVCCIRLPAADGGRRVQEVSTHSTMVTSLCELANRLVGLGVERVVMEATSDYWRPPFYLLEAHGLDPWLVNAKDVKHLPGRPKTDRLDAVWLCKVAERGMLRPSFVPPVDIRRLRDLTRYRIDLVGVRTAEKSRVEKLLEDACIKLSVVASDIFGVSGRAMMTAPRYLLLDEPSLGLAPQLVGTIRDLITQINEQGTTVLLVEQNASMALSIADHGYVLETGRVVMDKPAADLLDDDDIKEFYLGLGAEGGERSFRDVKHYRRRKRWLS